MAEIATVARPYAEALFKSALERNSLGATAEGLAFVAAAERDPQMRSALSNPKVSAQQKKELFAAVGGDRMGGEVKNLLAVLIDGHREVLIGSIAEQFDERRNDGRVFVREPRQFFHGVSAHLAAARLEEVQLLVALDRGIGGRFGFRTLVGFGGRRLLLTAPGEAAQCEHERKNEDTAHGEGRCWVK